MKRLKRYLLRIREASPHELAYRIRQLLFIHSLRKTRPALPLLNKSYNSLIQIPRLHFDENVDETVQQLLRGKTFSFDGLCNNVDYWEKRLKPIYFSDIDIYNEAFDVRVLWEPARLQHLAYLSLYMLQNPRAIDRKTIKYVKSLLFQWFDDNPFPYGPHYISAMECALRIPVFVYCLKCLADDLTWEETEKILEQVYLNAWFVANRLSLFSSLGNHTIAECVGLIIAGLCLGLPKAKAWLENARELLIREASHQVLEDGGPGEQSTNYHRFVLDLYWLAHRFLQVNGLPDLGCIAHILEKAERFLYCLGSHDGYLPSIGDSDDGFAVAPGVRPERMIAVEPGYGYFEFPSSGYSVFRLKNGSILTFDHGPLGMPPLYNHGHADALSITLSKNGVPFFVDPGTYSYNVEPMFRKYFKGTRAHNTVNIDQQDQAVQKTSFIWSKPYQAKLEDKFKSDNSVMLIATHTGYMRLRKPVVHKRVIFFFNDSNFLIRDSFSGEGIHYFELNFHVHPDCFIDQLNWGWEITNSSERIFIRSLSGRDFEIRGGERDPVFGWFSPSYGVKQESKVLSIYKKDHPKNTSFLTLICTEKPITLDNLTSLINFYG